jgi:lysophospholipase L1-like esterase
MRRWRLSLLIAGAVLLLAPTPVVADNEGDEYLALGDSVAFGYRPPPVNPFNIGNFIGYPEALAASQSLTLTNAACPGEASSGFISLGGDDNVCRPYRFLLGAPLHTAYTTSQLDFAVDFLHRHPQTRLITMSIGANDVFVLQKSCPPPPDDVACVVDGLNDLLPQLAENLGSIYSALSAAGFHGQLVAVTYYVDDYDNPATVGVIAAVNAVVASVTRAFGGQVADGFGAFAVAAAPFGGNSCVAGLLIRTGPGPHDCDVHPSPEGRDLLAQAVADVLI